MGEKIPVTPWPIELGQHPMGSKRKETAPEGATTELPAIENIEGRTELEIAKECFEHPEQYRNWILEHVAVDPKERLEGGSVFYMWLTKACPVGCEFCFFQSPEKSGKGPDEEISDEGIEKIIQITKDGNIDKLVVSGGGEPLLRRHKVNNLARGVNVKNLIVVTSAFWSKGPKRTDIVLSELLAATNENPNETVTTVRVSLDEGHLQKLSKDESFQYIQNIADWFAANAAGHPRFKLMFHTMDGDQTVENYIATLQVKERTERVQNKECVTLENGLSFGVEHTQMFFASPFVNLKDEQERTRNDVTFTKFVGEKRGGNMSMSFHGQDKPKGAYFLSLYDGTTIVWGSTAPDSEASIYKEDYDAMMDKNFRDVVTLRILEKGQMSIQDLVSEVNPSATQRAVGVGLRDFYVRLLLEEDTTRLYVSIRSIQEFIEEGRITEEDQREWPQQLKAMVGLPLDQLKEACLASKKNIVQQYLADPAVSAEKLMALYTRVALGHYSFGPQEMCEAVAQSEIDPAIRSAFLATVSPQQSGLGSM